MLSISINFTPWIVRILKLSPSTALASPINFLRFSLPDWSDDDFFLLVFVVVMIVALLSLLLLLLLLLRKELLHLRDETIEDVDDEKYLKCCRDDDDDVGCSILVVIDSACTMEGVQMRAE